MQAVRSDDIEGAGDTLESAVTRKNDPRMMSNPQREVQLCSL